MALRVSPTISNNEPESAQSKQEIADPIGHIENNQRLSTPAISYQFASSLNKENCRPKPIPSRAAFATFGSLAERSRSSGDIPQSMQPFPSPHTIDPDFENGMKDELH